MSLNNSSKEQFMNRSGSFSTHGSKRGYSDLGMPLSELDLLPPDERRKILLDRKAFLNSIARPTKKQRAEKVTIDSELSKNALECKNYNIRSEQEISQRMNFGRFFLEYCKKHMPKDQYLNLANGARKEFDETNEK